MIEWIAAWIGTTAAGAVFGSVHGWFEFAIIDSSESGIAGAIAGLIAGLLIANATCGLIFPTIAALLWTFWLLDRADLYGHALAGATVGLVAGFLFGPLCLVTAVMGAMGALLPVLLLRRRYRAIDSTQTIDSEFATRFNFTTGDLLLRTAVIAVLIAVWRIVVLYWPLSNQT